MTLNGAIKQLHELRIAEDMPIYYKLVITEVINVLLMDAQEVRYGRWVNVKISISGNSSAECSLCGAVIHNNFSNAINYCPNCGALMVNEDE